MKTFIKIISLIVLTSVFMTMDAQSTPAPFKPHVYKKFQDIQVLNQNGNHMKTVARAIWDFDIHGGSTTVNINLGVNLPAKAVITNSWYRIDSLVSSTAQASGDGTGIAGRQQGKYALQCEDSENILSATETIAIFEVTGGAVPAGDVRQMKADNSIGNYIQNIGATCALTTVLSVAPFISGKITHWIEYEVSE